MAISNQVEDDFKTALKNHDEITLSAVRNLKAAIKNAEIDKRGELSDAEVIDVIRKKVKQHKDSIENFSKGNRQDLVEFETKQMLVLEKYLPAQMGEDELRTIIKNVISDLNARPKDFGKVMKEVLTKSQGSADGATVSKLVKEILSS